MKKVGNEKLLVIRFCLPYHTLIITQKCVEIMKTKRKSGKKFVNFTEENVRLCRVMESHFFLRLSSTLRA